MAFSTIWSRSSMTSCTASCFFSSLRSFFFNNLISELSLLLLLLELLLLDSFLLDLSLPLVLSLDPLRDSLLVVLDLLLLDPLGDSLLLVLDLLLLDPLGDSLLVVLDLLLLWDLLSLEVSLEPRSSPPACSVVPVALSTHLVTLASLSEGMVQ